MAKKNYCFILCNIKSHGGGLQDLTGYKKDVEYIKQTFNEAPKFIVKHEQDKTAREMEEIIENDWCELDFSLSDCMILFILSHGTEHGVVLGLDGEAVSVNYIRELFDNVDDLNGKPKLTFVQACRGDLKPQVEEYSTAGRSFVPKKCHDSLVYYSTSEGYVSFVHNTDGTFFIHQICDVLKEHSSDQSFHSLVTKVNAAVSKHIIKFQSRSNAQASEVIHTLCSDLNLGFNKNAGSGSTPVRYQIKERNPCVILVNDKCGTHENVCRAFREKQSNVKKTFQELNFETQICVNLTHQEIVRKFEKEVKVEDYSEKDCFACVILSCGTGQNDSDVIFGSNGKFCNIDRIISEISRNDTLLSKPKLIFLVLNDCDKKKYNDKSMQQGNEQDGYNTAGGTARIAKTANTFLYYVIVKRDKDVQVFLDNLCNILSKSIYEEYHIGEVVFKVNQLIREDKRLDIIPEVCSSLTQEVYFTNIDEICRVVESGYQFATPTKDTVLDESNYQNECVMTFSEPAIDMYARDMNFTQYTFSNISLQKNTEISVYNPRQQKTKLPSESDDIDTDQTDLVTPSRPCLPNMQPTSITTPLITTIHEKEKDKPNKADPFDISPSSSSTLPNRADPINISTCSSSTVSDRAPLIKDLKRKHIAKLITFLDDISGVIKNFEHLGKLIFQGNRDKMLEVDHLKRQLYVAGSPGRALLEKLTTQNTDLTVIEFKDCAKRLKRGDIVKLLKDVNPNVLLGNMEADYGETYHKFIILLEKPGSRAIKNWKDFAYEYDLEDEEVEALDSQDRHEVGSPTEGLLKMLKTSMPNYRLGKLRDDLSKIDRNDVAQYLDEVIEELTH